MLARPFYDVVDEAQDAVQIAYPGFSSGSLSVRSTSRVGGGDIFFQRMLAGGGCRRFDLLAGYQFSRIDADVAIATLVQKEEEGGLDADDTVVDLTDIFDTSNSFHAAEFGFLGEYQRGPITWSLLAKVGLGNMRQRTRIVGSQVTLTAEEPAFVERHGLMALDTNSGVYKRDVFAVSPEIAFTGAYHLNHFIALTFGYSLIYWTNVAQPGDQIDTYINPSQITSELDGPARPVFPCRDAG